MAKKTQEPLQRPFTESEHKERVKRAKAVLKRAGLDCYICVAPELLYYFAGYEAHTHFSTQALVFGPGDDEPTFVVRDVDLGRADVTCWVPDVRTYRHGAQDPAELVTAVVKEHAAGGKRIGADLKSYALTGLYALRLVELLRPAKLEDCSDRLDAVRLAKSEQEMAYVREAGRIAEVGLQRALKFIRPGVTEIQVAGEIEKAMRDAGSEYPAMPCWVNSGPRRGGHKTPDHRAIEVGDSMAMEFAGVHRRYHAVTMQTVVVGKASPELKRTYDVVLKALRAGSAAIRPGVPVSAAEDAAVEAFVQEGYDPSIRARFGYGVSAAYPPTWLDSLDITAESRQVFQPNMSFVLHTGTGGRDSTFKILIGGAYVLTSKGLEAMSGGDLEMAVL